MTSEAKLLDRRRIIGGHGVPCFKMGNAKSPATVASRQQKKMIRRTAVLRQTQQTGSRTCKNAGILDGLLRGMRFLSADSRRYFSIFCGQESGIVEETPGFVRRAVL